MQFDSSRTATAKGDVVVVGSANQDLVAYTTVLPTMGQTVLGDGFETSCGGKGANQAIAAAAVAAPNTVRMICRVGNDAFGKALLDNFDKAAVRYDRTQTIMSCLDETTTGVAPIVVDKRTGDNMILVIPGANHALTPQDVQSTLVELQPRVVLVQLEILYETALEALRVGKNLGALCILNPAPAPNDESNLEMLQQHVYPLVDVLVPNETELKILYGTNNDEVDEETMAKALLDRGIQKAVIVTLGARGAMVVSKHDTTVFVDAPSDLSCRNDPVEDTVGAGDAFCGSLASYVSSGMSLTDAAIMACGVASMSVRKRGAQSSYPTAQELPDMLKISRVSTETRIPPTITFVTGNAKKLQEVQTMLSQGSSSSSTEKEFPFCLVNQKIDLPELQGRNAIEVAKAKCKLAFETVGGPVLIEDTSLCFNALNGMPGIYIKWFLESCGHEGLNDMLVGFDDKTAYAQTVMALSVNGTHVHVFEGVTQGTIVRPRGSLDFGWDPIFEPLGKTQTYAEMTNEGKNAMSHRGRALAKLKQFLMEHADMLLLG